MKNRNFLTLLSQAGSLSEKQKAALFAALGHPEIFPPHEAGVAAGVADDEVVCPDCASTSVRKWGVLSGQQRYRCKKCRATFNALSGTALAGLRKSKPWLAHSQALVNRVSETICDMLLKHTPIVAEAQEQVKPEDDRMLESA